MIRRINIEGKEELEELMIIKNPYLSNCIFLKELSLGKSVVQTHKTRKIER